MKWLASHDEIQMLPHEVHSLTFGRLGEFVSTMHGLPKGKQYIRGYKAPRDIQDKRVLRLIRRYWPNAGLIVGLRHPILWFESFYNYRLSRGKDIPPVNSSLFLHVSYRIGQCYEKAKVKYMCTDGALFQNHLSLLGKTNMTSQDELKLIRPRPKYVRTKPKKMMTNRVFLYEQSQLNDPDKSRAAHFREDLGKFLGIKTSLQQNLQPLPEKSASKGNSSFTRISICDYSHKALRMELMKNARTASLWIRNYFLEQEDVFVSSPAHFGSLLQNWMRDPCENGLETAALGMMSLHQAH